MRFLWRLMAVLLVLAMLAISVVGVMAFAPLADGRLMRVNAMGHSIIDAWRPANGLFWLWLALFFASLLALLTGALSLRRRKLIEVQMGGGRVVILDSAIRKYVKSALHEIPDIHTRRIDMRQTRQGIDIDVAVDVRTNQKLPDLERRIIERVRTAVAEELGIASINSVHVSVLDVELAKKPEPVRKRRTEQEFEDSRETENPRQDIVIRAREKEPLPMSSIRTAPVVVQSHEPEKLYRPFQESRDSAEVHTVTERVYSDSSLRQNVQSQEPAPVNDSPTLSSATVREPVTRVTETFNESVAAEAPASTEKTVELTSAPRKKKRGLFGLWGNVEPVQTAATADDLAEGDNASVEQSADPLPGVSQEAAAPVAQPEVNTDSEASNTQPDQKQDTSSL